MIINRLYTEPALIKPILFAPGINVILGESDQTSHNKNGVGKSLCIEFINFAFLKRKSESRVSKIPKESFDPRTLICVEFEIGGSSYIIKRSLEDAEHPRIVIDGKETVYAKLKDATDFLTGRLFVDRPARVGFREILNLLIRDERSEFKSIVACFDTKARVPDNYAPHLMLLGIDPDTYRFIKEIQKEIDAIASEIVRIKENVNLVRQKSLDDARSDLNALDDEVDAIREGIDALENAPAYDIIKGEIFEIEDAMSQMRYRRDILSHKSANLSPIISDPTIDSDEILYFYNQLRSGLGTNIVRDLNEVLQFKSKIEQFQRHLLNEKSKVLDVEIRELNKKIIDLDKRYSKLVSVLDQGGQLRNLRQSYASFQVKSDELGQLKSFINRYDELLIERQFKRSEIEADRLELQSQIHAVTDQLRSFERKILDIHQFIQGNRKASFDVRVVAKKSVLEIVLRVDNDGSHSVEREKVFIYDISLLLNEFTRSRHPGLLIHDNIFDVDEHTLQKSLEYLLTRARFEDDQQYILTLNVDRIENSQDEFWYDELQQVVVASFTKSNRFLRMHYQEVG